MVKNRIKEDQCTVQNKEYLNLIKPIKLFFLLYNAI